MTFKDAAVQVLTNNQNKPLSASEIWDEIERLGLVQSNGKTPSASLHTRLLYYSDNSNSEHHYKEKVFTIVDKNPLKFVLLNNIEPPISIEEEIETNKSIPIYECVLDDKGNILKVYNDNDTLKYETEYCTVGFTYFTLDEMRDKVKIGKETYLGDRLKVFKTANPGLKTIFTLPNITNEKVYHKIFDDLRSDGEWFFYAKGIREFIDNEKLKREDAIKSYNLFIESKNQEKEFLKHF